MNDDAVYVELKSIKERLTRHEVVHSNLWDEWAKLRDRLDRLPAWATVLIGILSAVASGFATLAFTK